MNRQRKPSTGDESTHRTIRAVYEEHTLNCGTRVAMITDPENEYAWIQSDDAVDLEDYV